MEKAWEKVCDIARATEHSPATYDCDCGETVIDRAVRNSPPPLDDVGGDVSDMLDEKDPTLAFLLSEREKTHGDYAVHANITQSLKDVMRSMTNWNQLTDCQKEALEMIAHKIGRVLAGNPDHVDHWDDIAGYAKLVSLDITSRQE